MEQSNIYDIFNSVQMGNLHNVKQFIESGGNINSSANGTSLLSYTIIYNKFDIFQYLIDNGAITSTSDLVIAIENRRIQIIDYLLEHSSNIDVNFADRKGNTIVMNAITMPNCFLQGDAHLDIIKCLIDHGADINIKNKKLESPLAKSVYRHQFRNLDARIVELLMHNNALL